MTSYDTNNNNNDDDNNDEIINNINRPAIVKHAMDAADKSSGIYSLGAVITHGASNKPICVGYNSNKRTTYKFGSRRMISCSQHAEMSVASQLLNWLKRKRVKQDLFESQT